MPRATKDSQQDDGDDDATIHEEAPGEVRAPRKRIPKRDPAKPVREKKPTRSGQKYDWEAISSDYIEGVASARDPESREWPTLEAVAKQHGVPSVRVRERSAQDRWVERRAAYQRKHALERRNKRITELSAKAIEFDRVAYTNAELAQVLIGNRLREIAEEMQAHERVREEAIRNLGMGMPVDPFDLQSAIDVRDLVALSQAQTAWQAVGNRALGADVVREVTDAEVVDDGDGLSITDELRRPDEERLVAFVETLLKIKGGNPTVHVGLEVMRGEIEAGEITDAEIVDEDGDDDGDEGGD